MRRPDPRAKHGTTGHEWDGIEELNTPLPRWWLWTWYACILWAFAYWVVDPAIPLATSFTKGASGWSSREQIVKDMDGLKTLRGPMTGKDRAGLCRRLKKSPELLSFARAQSVRPFLQSIVRPAMVQVRKALRAIRNPTDDDWLWGGSLDAIHRADSARRSLG